MNELKIITDYRDLEPYRLSFNRLAQQVFGISFEQWYRNGYWDERYICFSYLDGDEIVANVSVNLMDWVLNGHFQKALQIGTVMTRPDYRGRGLSSGLLRYVLQKYKTEFDLIYLFGNKDVLDYYPKFGFKRYRESRFELNMSSFRAKPGCLRKLNAAHPADLELIDRQVTEREPVSRVFGVQNAKAITMWYCFNILSECFYYLPEEDTVVVMEKDNRTLFLYDVIHYGGIDFKRVIPKLISANIQKVAFGFTPDRLNVETKPAYTESDDALFILTDSVNIPEFFKHPATAQA